MARNGDSFVEIAAELGVVVDTLHEWKTKYPEFSEAYKIAKVLCEKHFMQIGRIGMRGMKNEKMPNFNTAVWIFWMKARFKWSDEPDQDQEDTGLNFV